MLKFNSVADAVRFVGFLAEGLSYVDQWTPTEINSGGCGVFAALLSDKLKALEIEHQIIALFLEPESDKAEKSLRDYLKTGHNLKTAGEDHVVIRIGDMYFDSTGVVNVEVLHSRDTLEICRVQLANLILHGDWNPMFDRDCQPFIQSKMDEIFEHVSDFHTGMFKQAGRGDVTYSEHTIKYRKMQGGGLPGMNNFAAFLSSHLGNN